MLNITVTGAKELAAQLESIKNSFQDIAVNVLDQFGNRVREQTARGKDFEGFRFHPYSRSYAAKKKVNRRDVNLRSNRPGRHMMDFLEAKRGTAPGTAVLTITDAEKATIAEHHNEGTDGMPKREFMGVGIKGEDFIVAKTEDELVKNYKGLIS